MTPFTMENPAQFLPQEGPSPLRSTEWANDYNLTKIWGALLNSPRTADQTTIGLFWVPNAGPMYSAMTTALAVSHALNTLDSARLFAMLWTGYADAASDA